MGRARASAFLVQAACAICTFLPAPPAHGQSAPTNPHARAAADDEEDGGGSIPGFFRARPDEVDEDAQVPTGTVRATVVDPDGKPLEGMKVTLLTLRNSVAKGESRTETHLLSDATGIVTFGDLQTGSGVSYRVTVSHEGAVYGPPPFALGPQLGNRVLVHVYPTTDSIDGTLIVSEAMLFTELKDDRLQVEQLVRIYNFGRTTWLPKDTFLTLPTGFTALVGQDAGDVGIAPVPNKGARLRGVFSPGRHEVTFRWQLPYSGQKEVSFAIGVPPHTAGMRVMSAVAPGMRLSVDGFPQPEATRDAQGQRILATARQFSRAEPLTTLRMSLLDIPTPGPERMIVVSLCAAVVLLGFVLHGRGRRESGGARRKAMQAALLADLEDLERAFRAGEIGPKTHARARRELIDTLCRFV